MGCPNVGQWRRLMSNSLYYNNFSGDSSNPTTPYSIDIGGSGYAYSDYFTIDLRWASSLSQEDASTLRSAELGLKEAANATDYWADVGQVSEGITRQWDVESQYKYNTTYDNVMLPALEKFNSVLSDFGVTPIVSTGNWRNRFGEGTYESVAVQGVIIDSVDTPRYKDRNQHLAGGLFGIQGALAGSTMYSPTRMPDMVLGKQKVDKNARLLNGGILSYLEYGYGKTMSQVMGGEELDLFYDTTQVVTSTVSMTIEFTDKAGTIIHTVTTDINSPSSDGGLNGEGGVSLGISSSAASMSELSGILENKFNALQDLRNIDVGFDLSSTVGVIDTFNTLNMVVSLYDIATNETQRFESKVASGLVGSVLGAATSTISNAVISMMGLTGLSTAQMVSVGYSVPVLIGTLLVEAFEYATGMDNHFGFGGQYIGINSITGGVGYTQARGVIAGVKDIYSSLTDPTYMSLSEVDINNFEAYSMASEADFMSDFGLNNDQMSELSMAAALGTNNIDNTYTGVNATLADFLSSIDYNFSGTTPEAAASYGNGSPTGSGEDSGLGIGGNRGGAGGFGSAAEAAAGGHTGGW